MDRRNSTDGTFIGFQLRVAGGVDLDLYMFSDENHARAWLKQPFVTDEGYAIRLVSYRKRKCCGEAYGIKVIKKMKPSVFLKMKQITKKGVIINLPE